MQFTQQLFICIILVLAVAKHASCSEKPKINKNIRDYTDADMERLYDQWLDEDDDDGIDDLENPLNIKKPEINMNDLAGKSPEDLLKLTKKGKTLMTFVKVAGEVTRAESEELTKLWQTSLWNNHLQAERYMIEDNRAIFLFKDGSQALEAKEFLVDQERCESITIENKVFHGKHHQKDEL